MSGQVDLLSFVAPAPSATAIPVVISPPIARPLETAPIPVAEPPPPAPPVITDPCPHRQMVDTRDQLATCLLLWAGVHIARVATAVLEGGQVSAYPGVWLGLDPSDGALLIEPPGASGTDLVLLRAGPFDPRGRSVLLFERVNDRLVLRRIRSPRWWSCLRRQDQRAAIADLVESGELLDRAESDPNHGRPVVVLTEEADADAEPEPGTVCCWGAVQDGPEGCTCCEVDLDVEPREPEPLTHLSIQPEQCAGCAFKVGNYERLGYGDERDQEEAVDSGSPFFCHEGMPRALRRKHSDGTVTECPEGDYRPIIKDGVPFKADGAPACVCAGWHAGWRRLAEDPEMKAHSEFSDHLGALTATGTLNHGSRLLALQIASLMAEAGARTIRPKALDGRGIAVCCGRVEAVIENKIHGPRPIRLLLDDSLLWEATALPGGPGQALEAAVKDAIAQANGSQGGQP